MQEQKTLTIGMIKAAARRHYEETGGKLRFLDAARAAAALEASPDCPADPLGPFLPLEQFWAFIKARPLIGTFPSPPPGDGEAPPYCGHFYIREENMFVREDDITVYIHVPYIFDGVHSHDHFEINYVYHGSCVLALDEREQTFQEGSFFILAPDSPHNVYTEGDSVILSIMLRRTTFATVFSALLKQQNPLADFLKNALYLKDYRGCVAVGPYQSRTIQQYMQRLMVAYYQDSYYHNLSAISILMLTFSHIMQREPGFSYQYDFRDPVVGNFNFSLVIQYIRQHYDTITLGRLAEHFHYSESFLSRLIARETGKHFHEMVKELKLQRARHLLQASDLTLAEIGEAVGYDVNHLSRAFKSYYHISPALFRRQAKENAE